jgi:ZIP family zinc transporter
LTNLLLYSGFAGITVFIGGLLGNLFNHHIKESPVKYEITHTLMPFGAGIILSALALVLIPKGMKELSLTAVSLFFFTGTIVLMLINRSLVKTDGQTATLLAMMVDFVPESIGLGAVFAIEPKMALLLAVIIGLQNLLAVFNSYRDSVQSGFTAHLITFASGGILYLLIQDIIPECKLDNNYLTSLEASLGFSIGIVGEKLI